jgi:hypothetical protein
VDLRRRTLGTLAVDQRGWVANVLEQQETRGVLRPRARFVADPAVQPSASR